MGALPAREFGVLIQSSAAAGEEFVRQAQALKEDVLKGREGESTGT